MKKQIFSLLLCAIFCNTTQAQLEGVRVETYYISDADDATDTLGGMLEVGTTTYRIFIDMLPGSRLINVYGDENHELAIVSTERFFNHVDRGVTFGRELNKSRFDEGTAALDTWLTIGELCNPFDNNASVCVGIPKEKDTDGSIIGGVNNDGGSTEIASGLLKNNNTNAGAPLTAADGLMVTAYAPGAWSDSGILDPLSTEDTSIFGSNTSKEFISNFAKLENSNGVTGYVESENEVIIAQLTTKGELLFRLNLTVEFEEDGLMKTIKYVGTDSNLALDEVFSPLLSYPWVCGCTDPGFLEASTGFACEDNSLCLTPVVLGCMDENACNYDPSANINIEDICCYIGYCNDRDVALVCPELAAPRFIPAADDIDIYPNPVSGFFNVSISGYRFVKDISVSVFDVYGRKRLDTILRKDKEFIDVSFLEPGIYAVQFVIEEEVVVTKEIFVY